MPQKLPKRAKNSAPLSDEATTAVDARHLYNQDLFGLNPQLDFRTRLIIGCYVLDNISPAVVRAAFARAHIYPPTAVQALKRDVSVRDGGQANRNSSRLLKDKAASELEELGKQASLMSSGDVICRAHAIVEGVLKANQYVLKPVEELIPGSRRKRRVSASKDDVDVPAHKKVIGMFTPDDSQKIADSFAAEQSLFNATHLFVCSENGCCRRFASYAWLAAHVQKVHGIALAALNASEEERRKDLMEKQRQAKVGKVAAVAAAVDPAQHVADLRKDALFECRYWFSKDGLQGDFCRTRTKTHAEMLQHYWCNHPHLMDDGMEVLNLETGESLGPDDATYEEMSQIEVAFYKAVLPEEFCEEAFEDALVWLRSFVPESGVEVMSVESLVEEYSASKHEIINEIMNENAMNFDVPPSPLRGSTKERRCSKCKQIGHQKNSSKCSLRILDYDSLLLSPASMQGKSIGSPRTPVTVQSSPK